MVEYKDPLEEAEYGEEEEIELSLGLSIGGSLRKTKKSKPVEKELPLSFNINTDPKENDLNIFSGSSLSPPVHIGDAGTDGMMLDLQTKREIHALRRQEARKKREEKQLKREISRARNEGEYASCDKRKLDARGDNSRENEDVETRKQCMNRNFELDPAIARSSSTPYPAVSMQYPPPPPPPPAVQYVPLGNGFAFPNYVMPCWVPAAAGGSVGDEKTVVHPVACRPFQVHRNCGVNFSSGCDSEQNSGKDGENGKPISNGSPGCSSSAISDHRSTSLQGGSSSDSGSNSSHSKSGKLQLNASPGSDTPGYSEHSASSYGQGIDKQTNYNEKAVSLSIARSSVTKPNEEVASETQLYPIKKPNSSTEDPTVGPLKETNGDMGKPPKSQSQNHDTPSLPQMPCVSTTGNGPNGKTITGFLYRYTKTEVSIVCVCHGSSFSPAEFVEHAGGIDVSHPLKHITVVPSAFG